MEQPRPIKAWASRLGGEGEPLTMAEAQLLASIAACDRLLEIRDSLQDMQCRLTRLELMVRKMVGESAYDAATSQAVRALAEAS